MSAEWTSPADLRAQVERLWSKGRLLADETLFPLELKLKRPESRALSERFEEVRSWIRDLESEPAFRIEWAEVDHRVLGRNRVPARVVVAERCDALRLIGRVADAERFRSLAAVTAERLPELSDWLARKPLDALEYAADWDRILDVLLWFRAHPRCGLYLRQLDIAGVDTKFIEARKPLLAELLGRGSNARRLPGRSAMVRAPLRSGDEAAPGSLSRAGSAARDPRLNGPGRDRERTGSPGPASEARLHHRERD